MTMIILKVIKFQITLWERFQIVSLQTIVFHNKCNTKYYKLNFITFYFFKYYTYILWLFSINPIIIYFALHKPYILRILSFIIPIYQHEYHFHSKKNHDIFKYPTAKLLACNSCLYKSILIILADFSYHRFDPALNEWPPGVPDTAKPHPNPDSNPWNPDMDDPKRFIENRNDLTPLRNAKIIMSLEGCYRLSSTFHIHV